MNGEPLRAGNPRTAGPFQLRSRLRHHAAGGVFAAQDGSGQWVSVVVLDPAAAADPAVRDRFEAAIAALAQQGKVRDAAPRGPLGWAALAFGSGTPDAAEVAEAVGLLDAAAPTGTGAAAPGEPSFAPHWSAPPGATPAWSPPQGGPPVTGQPLPGQASPSARGASNTPLLAGLVTALVLLVVVSAAVVTVIVRDSDEPAPRPTASAPVAQPPSSAPPTQPTPTSTSTPRRSTGGGGGKDGPPGPVAGPTYGQGEDTSHMKLAGMPFEFDAPGTWGCMRSSQPPFTSRWICIDEGGTFPSQGSGAGGLVAVQPCPAPCGAAERKQVRTHIVVDADDWRRTDATTMYAEITGTNSKGKRVVRVAMSHVFASRQGGPIDTAVAVQLTGPPDQKKTMQKLINEIRTRTP